MASNSLLYSMVSDDERRLAIDRDIRHPAPPNAVNFERLAHMAGKLSLYWDTAPLEIRKALHWRHLVIEAKVFGALAGHPASFAELELLTSETQPVASQRFRDSGPMIEDSTKSALLPALYLRSRANRHWFDRTPRASEFAALNQHLHDQAELEGVFVGDEEAKALDYQGLFDSTGQRAGIGECVKAWYLSRVFLDGDEVDRMLWLLSLPAIIHRAGFCPLPSYVFGDGFSFNRIASAKCWTSVEGYVCQRLALGIEEGLRDIGRITQRVQSQTSTLGGHQDSAACRLLPWLSVKTQFSVYDVAVLLGVTRMTANRVVAKLCSAGLLFKPRGGNRNRLFRPTEGCFRH